MADTLVDTIGTLSMTVGRGTVARGVAQLAAVGPSDRVLDIGCGPGAAVRAAAARGATATGVDPSTLAIRLARDIGRIGRTRRAGRTTFVTGTAEALPVPDAGFEVAWTISSFHHWADPAAGLAEAHRVLATGGRLFLVERLVAPGARGHRAHGISEERIAEVSAELARAGFTDVDRTTHRLGRRTVAVIQAVRPADHATT